MNQTEPELRENITFFTILLIFKVEVFVLKIIQIVTFDETLYVRDTLHCTQAFLVLKRFKGFNFNLSVSEWLSHALILLHKNKSQLEITEVGIKCLIFYHCSTVQFSQLCR
jgi:hypothetical protein